MYAWDKKLCISQVSPWLFPLHNQLWFSTSSHNIQTLTKTKVEIIIKITFSKINRDHISTIWVLSKLHHAIYITLQFMAQLCSIYVPSTTPAYIYIYITTSNYFNLLYVSLPNKMSRSMNCFQYTSFLENHKKIFRKRIWKLYIIQHNFSSSSLWKRKC